MASEFQGPCYYPMPELAAVLEVKNIERPFYIEDSLVVMQVSHNIVSFPFTLLTPVVYTGGRTDI